MLPAYDFGRPSGKPEFRFKGRKENLLLPHDVLFPPSFEFPEIVGGLHAVGGFETLVLLKEFIQSGMIVGVVLGDACGAHRRNRRARE